MHTKVSLYLMFALLNLVSLLTLAARDPHGERTANCVGGGRLSESQVHHSLSPRLPSARRCPVSALLFS